MDILGHIGVMFEAQTQAFNASINSAADMLGSVQARMNRNLANIETGFGKLNNTVEGAGRKFAGMVTAYFGIQFVKNSELAADAMYDMSRRAKTSVETLDALSLVAKQNGVNLETVARAIANTSKFLGEARDNGSGAAKTLKEMNLSLDDLLKMSPEDRFFAIARRISEYSSEADQATLSNDVFKKSWFELSSMFADGVEPVEKAVQGMKKAGDVLSTQDAQRISEFNDKWDAFVRICERFVQSRFIDAFDAYARIKDKVFGSDTRIPLQDLDNLTQIQDRIQALQEMRRRTVEALKDEDDPENFAGLREKIQQLSAEIDAAQKAGAGMMGPFPPAGGAKPPSRKLPTVDKEASDAAKKEMQEAQKVYDDTRTAAEQYAIQVDKLDQLLMKGSISEDTYSRGIAKAHEQFEKADESGKKLQETVNELGFTFSSAFEDAIVEGKNLRDVLQGVAQDIFRILIRQTVTEPAANALKSIFSGLDLGSLFGFGKAMGGDVTPGKIYPINERIGTEYFAPGMSGRILTSAQVEGATGNRGNTYVIDARGTDSSVVRRLEQMLLANVGPGSIENRMRDSEARGIT